MLLKTRAFISEKEYMSWASLLMGLCFCWTMNYELRTVIIYWLCRKARISRSSWPVSSGQVTAWLTMLASMFGMWFHR